MQYHDKTKRPLPEGSIRDNRGPFYPRFLKPLQGESSPRLGSSLRYYVGAVINRRSLCLLAALWVATVSLTGCDNAASPISKLNRTNYDQIHEKMSKDQVQAVLGPPTAANTEDKLIYKRTIWRYTEGDKYINITFKNENSTARTRI